MKFWPFSAVLFLGLLAEPNRQCTTLRETFKFTRWTLRNVFKHASYDYVSFFPETVIQQSLNEIGNISCRGELLGRVEILEEEYQVGQIILLAFSLVVMIFVWVCQYFLWNQTGISAIAKIYQILLLVGTTFSFLSLIFWFLVPKSIWICQLRIWLLSPGICLLFGTIFCRTLQLKKIQQMIAEGRVRKTLNHHFTVGVGMSVVMGIDLILLIIWTSSDPYSATYVAVDDLNLLYQRTCTSDNIFLWFGLQGLYFLILLLWGVLTVYMTWHIHIKADDSRLLVMSIYTSAISVIISAIVVGSALTQDSQFFWWAVVFILLIVISLTGSVYLPRLLEVSQASSDKSPKHIIKKEEVVSV